ncbi:hypothetical protein [Schaalia hyovaginalis]|uniref:hypothetical protein n=1 Tax=Schaalia hyovaginalis TaxID=29316 RepID=UPI0026EAC7C1|nr:hypothetical protein [Schaalia hyovaginalis]MCI7513318.1 hypothetical protein [Schaalia hyovaginalis]MDY3665619.1 hypothetical protein [Schaalia hyovaginalis]MDY4492383.1 hypothetical protein [Schaalia hyovaginalis]
MRTRAMTAFSATMLGGLLLLAPIGAASAEGAGEGNPDPSIEQPAPSPLSLTLADDGVQAPSPDAARVLKVGQTRRIVLTLSNDGTSDLKELNVTDVNVSPALKLVEKTCRPHDEILSPTSKFVLGVDQSVTCSFTLEGVSKGPALLSMTAFGTGDAGNTGAQVGFYVSVVEDAPVPPVVPDKPVDPVDPVNPDKPVEPENPAQPEKPVNPGKPADSGKPADKPSGPQAPASTTTPASSTTAPAASKRSEAKLANTGAALIGVLPLAAALGVGGVMLGRRKRS